MPHLFRSLKIEVTPRPNEAVTTPDNRVGALRLRMEFGKFPDSSTVAAVRSATGSALTLADRTSNDLFAQLFAAGMVQARAQFYAKAISARKTDGIFTTDATLLEHGECGFAYISGLLIQNAIPTPHSSSAR